MKFNKTFEILCVANYNRFKNCAVLAALFPNDHHVSMQSVVTTAHRSFPTCKAFSFVSFRLQLLACAVLLLNFFFAKAFEKVPDRVLAGLLESGVLCFVFCDCFHATIYVFVSINFGAFL
jgi:hypothetical protein